MPFQQLMPPIGMVLIIYLIWRFSNRKKLYLKKNGIRLKARLIDIEKTNISINERRVWKLTVEFIDTYNVSQVVKFKERYSWLDSIPQAGEEVDVLVDPNNINRLMTVRD